MGKNHVEPLQILSCDVPPIPPLPPQHVCPVLNMKYGVFERKEGEGGEGRGPGGLGGLGQGALGVGATSHHLLHAALTLARRGDS